MKLSRKDLGAAALFILLMIAFVLIVNSITANGNSQELNMVREAVKNAALTCYAVEGLYPAELDYLQEHYQLSYNEERYLVYYEAFASNLMPSIQVVERGVMDL